MFRNICWRRFPVSLVCLVRDTATSGIYSRKCFSFIFGMVGEVVRDTAESRPGLVLMIQQVPDGGFPIVNKRLSSSYGSSRWFLTVLLLVIQCCVSIEFRIIMKSILFMNYLIYYPKRERILLEKLSVRLLDL